MSEDVLDATGIYVDVRQTGPGRLGSKRWKVPLGGGAVQDDEIRVRVEVAPAVDMPRGRWRDYAELEVLADKVALNGGFMICNDSIQIGDEILVGRDVFDLLVMLNRRCVEREEDGVTAAFRQGFEAGVRSARQTITDALDTVITEGEES